MCNINPEQGLQQAPVSAVQWRIPEWILTVLCFCLHRVVNSTVGASDKEKRAQLS